MRAGALVRLCVTCTGYLLGSLLILVTVLQKPLAHKVEAAQVASSSLAMSRGHPNVFFAQSNTQQDLISQMLWEPKLSFINHRLKPSRKPCFPDPSRRVIFTASTLRLPKRTFFLQNMLGSARKVTFLSVIGRGRVNLG